MPPVADAADRQLAKDGTGHASRSTTVVSAPAPAAGGGKKPARFGAAWAHAASSSLAWRTPMSCRTLLLAFVSVVVALNAAARAGTPSEAASIDVLVHEGTSMAVAVAPDGSQLHQVTWGPFDDREPVWSHDGTQLAFASDRGDPLGSHYHIWVLDRRSGQVRQVTEASSEDSMPTWSPDDQEIAFASM